MYFIFMRYFVKTFFSEFPSFVHIISKLSILSNHTNYLKGLVLYYILPSFTILKSLYPTS